MDWAKWWMHTRLTIKIWAVGFVTSEIIGNTFAAIVKIFCVFLTLGLFYNLSWRTLLVSVGVWAVAEYLLAWGITYAKVRGER